MQPTRPTRPGRGSSARSVFQLFGDQLNVAVALSSLVTPVSLHVAFVPVQAPLQPAKLESLFGAAVRVTSPPVSSVQDAPEQDAPGLDEVALTVPVPSPGPTDPVTVTCAVNAAVALSSLVTFVSAHVRSIPVQAPLQPVNASRLFGVAVRVTSPPLSSVQDAPEQDSPGLDEVALTLPSPVGLADPMIVTRPCPEDAENTAPTLRSPDIATVHGPLPVQSPVQDVKVDGLLVWEVSVRTVPTGKLAVQVPGHEIPAGRLVTAPDPLMATVSLPW